MDPLKIIRFGAECALLATLMLAILAVVPFAPNTDIVMAQNIINLPTAELKESGFAAPKNVDQDGVEIAKGLAKRIVDIVRVIVGAVAILMIVVSAIKLISAQGNEEVYTKEVTTLTWAIIGLAVIAMAGEVANILDVEDGGFLKDPNVIVNKSKLFGRTTKIAITFIKFIIGSVCVLFIVRSAMSLVISGDSEEQVKKDKASIMYSIIGLIIIAMANPFINNVFFKVDKRAFPGTKAVRPGIDIDKLVQEIGSITNIFAAIAGPVAMLSLVYGGLLYILSAGDDDKQTKAKQIITWSLAGMVIIFSAFGLVSTFISRRFSGL